MESPGGLRLDWMGHGWTSDARQEATTPNQATDDAAEARVVAVEIEKRQRLEMCFGHRTNQKWVICWMWETS